MNLEKFKNIGTNFIGKNILFFNEIDSTQKEAKRRINKGEAKNGEIIIANNQLEGEGTHGRKWYTGENENIAFSIILFPNCNINKLKKLTIIIAECIVETINMLYNIKLQIKEPNDIVCNNKKIGGILTQIVTNDEIVKNIIIGVGLNVNQNEFPEEISCIASSLKNEFGKGILFLREDVILDFCKVFEREYIKIGITEHGFATHVDEEVGL